jgi:hypothetical protein
MMALLWVTGEAVEEEEEEEGAVTGDLDEVNPIQSNPMRFVERSIP